MYLAQAPINILLCSPSLIDGSHSAWLGTPTIYTVSVPATGPPAPPTVAEICSLWDGQQGLMPLAPAHCLPLPPLLSSFWLALAVLGNLGQTVTAVTPFFLSPLPTGLVPIYLSPSFMDYFIILHYSFFFLQTDWGKKEAKLYLCFNYNNGKHTFENAWTISKY